MAAVLLLAAGGCATSLPVVERAPSYVLRAPAEAPLSRLAEDAGIAPGKSGAYPLVQAAFALDARLALIEAARVSLDLQYYEVADDGIGHAVLRGLRDAARRGVQVRLLIDDIHTVGMDRLLLGLAAEPNVSLRLFNPFAAARQSSWSRLLNLAGDFGRLNHRMHNKLFIADGAVAIVGGRNLANEYFLRGTDGNFIDFDLLATGAVMSELDSAFDLYWNSDRAYPVQAIVTSAETPEALRQAFDETTRARSTPAPPPHADVFGFASLRTALATRRFDWMAGDARAYADAPDKGSWGREDRAAAPPETVNDRFLKHLATARHEILLFSPYFVPGRPTIEAFRAARADGVTVRVVTNSLAVSDVPLVNVGYMRHRRELLEMGVELYEMSSSRLKRDTTMRELLGTSTGRLHAKMGFIDGRVVLVGSMNIDPRSAIINTEIGLAFDSPSLARMIVSAYRVAEFAGVYRVHLSQDGGRVRWSGIDEAGRDDEYDSDPETSWWQRIKSAMLSWIVPEGQL
jgi:cardiolipin synthase C